MQSLIDCQIHDSLISAPWPIDSAEGGAEMQNIWCSNYTDTYGTHDIVIKLGKVGQSNSIQREFELLMELQNGGKKAPYDRHRIFKFCAKALKIVDNNILILEKCGRDIRHFIGAGRFSEDSNVKKLAMCLKGLHDLNFFHNDIKPEVHIHSFI